MMWSQKRKPHKSRDLRGFRRLRGEDLNLRPSGYERDEAPRRYDVSRLFAAWSGLERTQADTKWHPSGTRMCRRQVEVEGWSADTRQ
jgi:hypothetical protein